MPEWLFVLLRAAGVFVLVLVLVRLLGKRQATQMTLFDLVISVVIGVIAAVITLNLAGDVIVGIVALLAWVVLPVLIYILSLRFKAVRDMVQGKETVLVNHGKVLEDKLLEARLSPEDLLSLLRRKNVFNIADVEFAVLEPDGELSVFLKKDQQPLTVRNLGLRTGNASVPQTVMLDGVIMDEPLTAIGLNRGWLHTELEKVGVAPENVFIAQVDEAGQLYLDLFDDAIQVPKPKTKELLHVTLKKCQADCELYALATKQPEASQQYASCAGALAKAVQELDPLLVK